MKVMVVFGTRPEAIKDGLCWSLPCSRQRLPLQTSGCASPRSTAGNARPGAAAPV